ncbi:MAG TPA: hypothetical protein VNJ01_17255 [Bacteriovoracaceae bacterium]|nr:hypothetical protein [Bacteriovoracaceae bacterium]
MNKFIPLVMGLLLPLTAAFAQQSGGGAIDEANQKIIDTCRTEKGTYITRKEGKCEYSGCAYVGSNGDVKVKGDNERIKGGCSLSDFRKKAQNDYKAQIDKEIADLEKKKKEAERIGATGDSRDNRNEDGDGDEYRERRDSDRDRDRDRDRDGDRYDREGRDKDGFDRDGFDRNGRNRDGFDRNGRDRDGRDRDGRDRDGRARDGSKPPATTIRTDSQGRTIGDDVIICEEVLVSGSILPGSPCYNECKKKKKFWGLGGSKEGLERESCIKCLVRNSNYYNIRDDIKNRYGVNIPGVSVRTGVIQCRDGSGRIVSVSGSSCPSGQVVYTGPGNGGGTGTVVINTGGNGNGGGRPDFCNSSRSGDVEKCSQWMRNNRFLCSSSSVPAWCMGNDYNVITDRYSRDCVNCGANGGRKQSTLSGIAEIVGAVAPPLAMLGSAYFGARAYQKSNEAWAGAAAVGFEQCQISQNNYLGYLAGNELPGLTPEQQRQMNCNGYSLGGYGGMQNGGLGSWYGAGYSPGFIGGMMGPYGGHNPYGGGGGMVGGAVGGIAGGGFQGGGFQGGYPGGYAGGYAAGGMAGGYPGGYVGGGYVAGGMAGGYPGGYAGGISGGMVNGISIAGGAAAGYPGGYAGGYAAGGMAGGYPGGYGSGGMAGGGYIAGGIAGGGFQGGGFQGGGFQGGGFQGGGFQGGGFQGGGMYGGGGYSPGGWGSGVGQGGGYPGGHNNGYWGGSGGGFSNVQSDYMGSMQAANQDRLLQQQGMSYQMGMSGPGYGGSGSAGYSPMNAGAGLSAQFGGSIYGGF